MKLFGWKYDRWLQIRPPVGAVAFRLTFWLADQELFVVMLTQSNLLGDPL